MAVLDFNRDGVPDLAVGAPSVGSEKLAYTVRLRPQVESGRGRGRPGRAEPLLRAASQMCRASICGR